MPEKTLISFTRGVPAPESFPAEQLAICAREVLLEESRQVLQYGQAAGYKPLREYLAGLAGVSLERILLGQGSLQLFDHLVRLLVKPGDTVLVEQPTYDRTLTLLRRAGASLVGIGLQPDGISLSQLEEKLKAGLRPLLFYVIPDFQNPTGSVMAEAKRRRLVELAQEYHFLVVEDAPYRSLRYCGNDLPSLFGLDPTRVLQMSSFSKIISPGLRVGYMVLPPHLAPRLIQFAEDTYINASFLNQAIVHRFIQKGWLESNLEELKQLYAPRLAALQRSLGKLMQDKGTWVRPDGGFFVGFYSNGKMPVQQLIRSAEQAGIRLSDGRGFFVEGGQNFIRLPFCALTPEEIDRGISRLSGLL
jgi:2-aminoadipate transaminase